MAPARRGRLGSLDDRVSVVVIPQVELIALGENRGGAARNAGVLAARTPFVAFADDDSWWARGGLARAADVLAAHPGLALVQAVAGLPWVLRRRRPSPPRVEAMRRRLEGSPNG